MALRLPDDLGVLSVEELSALIGEATELERRVSDRRLNLQNRLDFLRSGGGTATATATDLLKKLEADEATISAERKELHRLIDSLHGERHRRSTLE